MSGDVIQLKVGEFEALQASLNTLKTQVYEGKEKEKRLQKLGLQWKAKAKQLDGDLKKAKAIIVNSKEAKNFAVLTQEKQQLSVKSNVATSSGAGEKEDEKKALEAERGEWKQREEELREELSKAKRSEEESRQTLADERKSKEEVLSKVKEQTEAKVQESLKQVESLKEKLNAFVAKENDEKNIGEENARLLEEKHLQELETLKNSHAKELEHASAKLQQAAQAQAIHVKKARLEEHRKSLEDAMKNKKAFEEQIEKLRAEHRKEHEDVEKYKTEIEKLTRLLEDKKAASADATEDEKLSGGENDGSLREECERLKKKAEAAVAEKDQQSADAAKLLEEERLRFEGEMEEQAQLYRDEREVMQLQMNVMLEQVEREKTDLKNLVGKTTAEQQLLQSETDSLRAESEQLRALLAVKKAEDDQAAKEIAEGENEQARKQQEEAERIKKEIFDAKDCLEDTLRSLNSASEKRAELEAVTGQLSEKLERLNQETRQSVTALEALKSESKAESAKLAETREAAKKREQEDAKMAKQKLDAKGQLEVALAKQKELKTKLQAKVDQMSKWKASLEREKKKVAGERTAWAKKEGELSATIAGLGESNAALKKELQTLKTEVASYRSKVRQGKEETAREGSKLREDADRSKAEAEAFKAQAQKLQKELADQKGKREELERLLEVGKQEKARADDLLKFAAEDKAKVLAEKKKQLEKLETKNEEQKKRMEAKITDFAERIKAKHGAFVEAAGARDELQKRLEGLEKESGEAHAKLEALEKEKGETAESFATELAELRGKLEMAAEEEKRKNESLQKTQERGRDLEQQIVDVKLERKIAEKKSVQLIKELKTELKKARSAMMKDRSVSATTPKGHRRSKSVTSQKPKLSPRTFVDRNTRRSNNNSNNSSANNNTFNKMRNVNRNDAESRGGKVDLPLLQEENNALIHKITQMQQQKWNTEEKIKGLEKIVAKQQQDLLRKKEVIRDYVVNSKTGARRGAGREIQRNTNKRMPTGHSVHPEVLAKMEEFIEETMLENLQLKKDMEVLGNEVQSLKEKARK